MCLRSLLLTSSTRSRSSASSRVSLDICLAAGSSQALPPSTPEYLRPSLRYLTRLPVSQIPLPRTDALQAPIPAALASLLQTQTSRLVPIRWLQFGSPKLRPNGSQPVPSQRHRATLVALRLEVSLVQA